MADEFGAAFDAELIDPEPAPQLPIDRFGAPPRGQALERNMPAIVPTDTAPTEIPQPPAVLRDTPVVTPQESPERLTGMFASFDSGDRRTAAAYQRLLAQVMARPGTEQERLAWSHLVMGEAQRRCEALSWSAATALESVLTDIIARRL